jgi:hypothetical protein
MGWFTSSTTLYKELIAQLRSEVEFLRNDHARILCDCETQRQRLTAERDEQAAENLRLRLAAYPFVSQAGQAYVNNVQREYQLSQPKAEAKPRPGIRKSWAEVQDEWGAQMEQERLATEKAAASVAKEN